MRKIVRRVWLSEETWNIVSKIAEEEGVSFSEVIENAIWHYYSSRREEPLIVVGIY